MASLVGQATDTRVTVTNLPLTHGLNLQPGDVLIAAVHWNSGTAITSDGNAFVTSLEEENPNAATSRMWIGYRICGASEPSSFAWSNATSERCTVVLAQFRGIDPMNVWHVPPSASTRGIGQPVTTLASPPSLTTTNKYTVGIGIAFSDAAGFTFSDWTNGYGQEIEHGSGEGLAMVLRHYDTAGAKGTLNTTVSSSGDLVVHHLALNTNTVQPVTGRKGNITFVGGSNAEAPDIGTITRPANQQVGDVIVAFVRLFNADREIIAPSGFTLVFEEDNESVFAQQNSVYYHVVDASLPASDTWDVTLAPNGGCVTYALYRGVEVGASPFAVFAGDTVDDNPSPSVTSLVDGAMLVVGHAGDATVGSWTYPSGFTVAQELITTSIGTITTGHKSVDKGATGTTTITPDAGTVQTTFSLLLYPKSTAKFEKLAYIEIPTPRRVIPLRQLDSTATYSYELPVSADTQAYVFGMWIEKTSAGQFDDVLAIEDDTPTWKWTFQTTNTTSPHTMSFWDDTISEHCQIATVLNINTWYYALCCLNYGSNLAALAIFDTRGNVLGDSTLNGTDNLNSTCTHLGIGNFPSQLDEAWVGHLANLKMWRGYTQLAGVSDQANRRQFARQEMFSFRPKHLDGLIGWYPLDNQYRNRPVMSHHQILGVVGTGLSLGNTAPPPIQEEPKIITLAPPKKRRLVML